ncbi:calcium-binding protein [Lentzea sp. NBRC 105346]|uniref:EF-hand domain-containing protein n=1 Tax=Lentzea sp. NBRC 105346 TaxID=3032205 RepID=UPI0024A5C136|nr:EF-hand domain-containing protein [Lentzea sp. NBRC 105346]GLZ33614.1 calcium-binding protein [Lentzea sp. NBRC 105346]
MLSELQIKNVGTIFDTLDHDKDGFFEREDFEAIGLEAISGIDLAADSPHRGHVVEAYVGWWEQIRKQADADGDGMVTRDEYIASVEQGLLSDPSYLDAVSRAADALFAAADVNGDGTLSKVEVVRIYGGIGLPEDMAADAFDQIDSDGDGKISTDEWRAAVQGAFTSVGPETVGSNMLGHAQ